MGDNGRRARAYPMREGLCPDCGRWLTIGVRSKIPRHRCFRGEMKHGHTPAAIHPDNTPEPTAKNDCL